MKIINVDAPLWFFQSEIVIQLIFAVVTLLIAFYSYRVYRIARQRSSFLFGVGFLSISVAYFLQAIFNFLLLRNVQTCDVLGFIVRRPVDSTLALSVGVVFLHMLFMVAGFSLIAYITLKEKNMKTYFLLLTLAIFGLLLSSNLSVLFYLILSTLLIFISIQYQERFSKKPTTDTFLVFLGFGMVFLGLIQLALSSALNALYISGHIVTLVGYILLLVNLMRVVRK